MKRHYEDISDVVTQRRLILAAEQVLKTKAITPLLKEELRLSILTRRHAQGAEFIKAEFKDPEMHELTPDEMEKKSRRREQNRRAAQKCRMKKKKKQDGWMENFSTIVQQNQKLVLEIETLKRQKMELSEILQQHLQSGKCWYVQECPNTLTQDSTHNLLHSACDDTQGNFPGTLQLWSENNAPVPRRTSTSSSCGKENEDINTMINLCDMDFTTHPQIDELLYDDLTADARRQGLSISSTSSDGEGLACYGAMEAVLSDPLQDDEVFTSQVQLDEIQPDVSFIEHFRSELSQCLNPVPCEKMISNEKCFFSEP